MNNIKPMGKPVTNGNGEAIAFRDVYYRVENGSGASRELVSGVELAVRNGETLVLLGRSGSGKTTLLRLINGMLLPSSGAVEVEGRATKEWDLIRLRRGIGYVIQEGGLFPHFTVADNVGLVPQLEGWEPGRIRARVADLLDRVNLP